MISLEDLNKKINPSNNDQEKEQKRENTSKTFEVNDTDREVYHNLVDILFVIDTTESMEWCLKEAKKTILDISKMFTKQEFDIKFAVCEYRDHPPQDYSFVYKHYNLSNADAIASIIQKLRAKGGGDDPEAVMDGLYQGLVKTSWRKDVDGTKSKRFLFHVCDAPPHGEQFGGYSCDPNWRKNGCPCKITQQMIGEKLKQKNVTYNLVECRELPQMVNLFKQCFGENFQEIIKIDSSQISNSLISVKADSSFPVGMSKRNFLSSTAVKTSSGGSSTSNIFNLQIQSNIKRNLK